MDADTHKYTQMTYVFVEILRSSAFLGGLFLLLTNAINLAHFRRKIRVDFWPGRVVRNWWREEKTARNMQATGFAIPASLPGLSRSTRRLRR